METGPTRRGGVQAWDLAVMGALLVLSLAQVLLEPIAARPVGVLFACVSVVPVAWRRTAPSVAASVGAAAWLIPTEGFLYLGYVVAVILFFSVGAHVADRRRFVLRLRQHRPGHPLLAHLRHRWPGQHLHLHLQRGRSADERGRRRQQHRLGRLQHRRHRRHGHQPVDRGHRLQL